MITVWTNGCFDILHVDHCRLLKQAKDLGDKLIVGLNSDESVRRIKGSLRPVNSVNDRIEMLMSIRWVDEVVVFPEDDPCKAIMRIKPDIVVKGRGYSEDTMPESDVVKSYGGRIVILQNGDESTTAIIERLSIVSNIS